MEIIEIFGYAGALIIGLVLGLIGGGGSILTVPIFVYLFGIDPVLATAYSLFVVGLTSLIGSYTFMKKGLISYRAAITFAIPSFIAVFLTRKYLIPAIPENLFTIAGFEVTKGVAIMVFFAIIMIVAAISMIVDKNTKEGEKPTSYNYPLIVLEGGFVGVLTGIVGAGGGFLIVPALVLLVGLDMKLAVGTSLLIIAAKSLIGFTGDLANQTINWEFLLVFTLLSVVGIFIGSWLSRFIKGHYLKKGFGWFVLIMGFIIIIEELL